MRTPKVKNRIFPRTRVDICGPFADIDGINFFLFIQFPEPDTVVPKKHICVGPGNLGVFPLHLLCLSNRFKKHFASVSSSRARAECMDIILQRPLARRRCHCVIAILAASG